MSEPQQPYGPPPGSGGQPAYGPPPAYGPQPGQPSGYGPVPGSGQAPAGWGGAGPQAPYTGAQETESKAVVALVLAVLAWTPVVPFIGAIAALVLASYASRDIDRAAGAKTGRGLVKAARILAWTHLAFCAVVFTLLLLVFVLGVGLSFAP